MLTPDVLQDDEELPTPFDVVSELVYPEAKDSPLLSVKDEFISVDLIAIILN